MRILIAFDGKGLPDTIETMEPWGKGYCTTTPRTQLRPPDRTALRYHPWNGESRAAKRGVLASLDQNDWVWKLSVLTPEAEDIDNYAGRQGGRSA